MGKHGGQGVVAEQRVFVDVTLRVGGRNVLPADLAGAGKAEKQSEPQTQKQGGLPPCLVSASHSDPDRHSFDFRRQSPQEPERTPPGSSSAASVSGLLGNSRSNLGISLRPPPTP